MDEHVQTTTPDARPEEWAVVEIMGYHKCAGRIAEVERFGAKMLRVDIPAGDSFVTEFFGGQSIYRLRPATEEVARAVAAQLGDPRPSAPVSYRLPAPRDEMDQHEDEDELGEAF